LNSPDEAGGGDMTTTSSDPGLQLRPMVHVADLAASIAFYRQLGGEIIHGGQDTDWVLMQLGTVQIGLVARPPDAQRGEGQVELTFGAAMPLEELEGRLHRAGFRVAEVTTDRDFGEQLLVRTPDDLLIKITEREPED
jgi:catechol 2,3-dioxygenase-like lactoylglutathione lyase family enzyme